MDMFDAKNAGQKTRTIFTEDGMRKGSVHGVSELMEITAFCVVNRLWKEKSYAENT